MSRRRVSLVLFLVLVLTAGCAAQNLSASASVTIRATKLSSITLSLRQVPVAFDVTDQHSTQVSIPLTTSWNVSPREVQGFEIVGYFANPDAALLSETNAIPAQMVEAQFNNGPFRAFNQSNPVAPAGGALSLATQQIMAGVTVGNRSDLLTMRVAESLESPIEDGEYRGVLYLEVRHF